MGVAGDDDMTLVVSLAALRRLERPAEALAGASQWSEHVGATSDAPVDETKEALDARGVDCDFVTGSAGKAGSLAAIRQRFPTDRHVLVGATDADRRTAEALGWEYLPVEEAAEKAGWSISDGENR